MYEYEGIIEEVVDGDTLRLDIDLGFNVHIKERVRLARIDCPEMKTPEGKLSKKFVMQFKGSKVKLFSKKIDRYGRYIGEITILEKNKNLSDIIVENGFAIYVKY